MVAFQTDGGNRLFNKSCWYNWPQPSKIDWGADPKCEKQNYITFQRNSNIMIPLTFLFSFFFFFFFGQGVLFRATSVAYGSFHARG